MIFPIVFVVHISHAINRLCPTCVEGIFPIATQSAATDSLSTPGIPPVANLPRTLSTNLVAKIIAKDAIQ